ncbi:hypothetical protein LCGC14_3163510, partial [marine sediment metagenome]
MKTPTRKRKRRGRTTRAETSTGGLAIQGGAKAITGFEGRGKPKVGVEEFLALAEVWGYSRAARDRIKQAIAPEADRQAPHLARYYNPRPSR